MFCTARGCGWSFAHHHKEARTINENLVVLSACVSSSEVYHLRLSFSHAASAPGRRSQRYRDDPEAVAPSSRLRVWVEMPAAAPRPATEYDGSNSAWRVEPPSCARPPSITSARKPFGCSGMDVSPGRRQLLECFRLGGLSFFASTATCKTQVRYAIIYKLVKYTKQKVVAEQTPTAAHCQVFLKAYSNLVKKPLIW
jgi:hypothetical protein